MQKPPVIQDKKYRYDYFNDGQIVPGKPEGKLPAMGWNSWNAFGSENSEKLTLEMAEKFIELGLKDAGYSYIVLDDGCYRRVRLDERLTNDRERFPSGFKALADKLHSMGLKFGMYNDIGTHLCGGSAVGTCGHEEIDAQTYAEWDIDFIKVDNCYYPWDDATFGNRDNIRFTTAPAIKEIRIYDGDTLLADIPADRGEITGKGVVLNDGAAMHISTTDGAGPNETPVGPQSGELVFTVNAPEDGAYYVEVVYKTGRDNDMGEWLQIAVDAEVVFDDLTEQQSPKEFTASEKIPVTLKKGQNRLRFMNHRRQENTLWSYSRFRECLTAAAPSKEILLSVCEWGKTQPQNWAYKAGNSWRIMNDITFRVGSPGKPGYGEWESGYTTSITDQYDKAVIMDEFSGLDKGWNDPDMMIIGLEGLDETMNRTHFTMWCMLNSPLMLGLDLRDVKVGDPIHRIITNKEVIALNQDALGVQAKRVFSTAADKEPDREHIRNHDRVDVLAKPLSDGSIAVSFFNLSGHEWPEEVSIGFERIAEMLGRKMKNSEKFVRAGAYEARNLWTGETVRLSEKRLSAENIPAHDSVIYRIYAQN